MRHKKMGNWPDGERDRRRAVRLIINLLGGNSMFESILIEFFETVQLSVGDLYHAGEVLQCSRQRLPLQNGYDFLWRLPSQIPETVASYLMI